MAGFIRYDEELPKFVENLSNIPAVSYDSESDNDGDEYEDRGSYHFPDEYQDYRDINYG